MSSPHSDPTPPARHHRGTGLEGQRLLPFMAALGCMVLAEQHFPAQQLRLGWQAGLAWQPIWTFQRPCQTSEFLLALHKGLKTLLQAPELGFADDLSVSAEQFRALLLQVEAEAHAGRRHPADFVAALGTELYPGDKAIQDTAFRTMSGAGHQHFLKTIRDILQLVEVSHLEAALFHPWRYSDERLSLRWDAADDRRYALRACNPSDIPPRTQWGANLLAAISLSCFPCMLEGSTLQTVGFRERQLRWPLWESPLPLSVIRALLNHRALWMDDTATLTALGVAQIQECDRISVDKFRSFSPARTVWRSPATQW